jgi:putative ABC transport system substrate-binding protein
MNRRELLILGGGAVGWPFAVYAQQKTMPVIGYLGGTSPGPQAPWVAAFRQGPSETGYVEGKNVAIEYRWAEGRYDRLPALAADLVARKVDVIVASSTAGIAAAKGASSTIPIPFFGGGDLAAAGLVASLARPGGNLTGFSICPTRSPHFARGELTKRIYDGPAAQLRAWPSLSPRCGRKDSIPTTIR